MRTSQIPFVLDTLVDIIRVSLASAHPDVDVLDGPEVTADPQPRVVCVGWDGDDEGDGQAVEWDQQWNGLGAKAKQELITVTCVVICRSGGDDLRAVRQDAFALFGAIETGLRGDVSIGLPPPGVATVAQGRLHQECNADGVEVRLPFTVGVQARI
ncbi:hypothetical protein HNP84_007326 [Thermocatellispora tengchongensis]|uniref:DUF3168 domain-containing protein n=1 Tax=Thermocatellispora tengchongensis TaxID=1073253 RepID=A0A840P886_9ACTN|nr:hypothetical protein [Thermocatellispora tengchongensis]MBB5137574.1 hypothetical protein [Thermocatellispora tengchongensis]